MCALSLQRFEPNWRRIFHFPVLRFSLPRAGPGEAGPAGGPRPGPARPGPRRPASAPPESFPGPGTPTPRWDYGTPVIFNAARTHMSAPWRFPAPTAYCLPPRNNSGRFTTKVRFAAPPPPRAPVFRGRLFALRGASTKRLSQAPGRVCPAPPDGPRGLSSAAALRRGLSSAALVAVAVEAEDQLARSRKTLPRGGAERPFMFPCPARGPRRLVIQSRISYLFLGISPRPPVPSPESRELPAWPGRRIGY